jgi:hypothetical protein
MFLFEKKLHNYLFYFPIIVNLVCLLIEIIFYCFKNKKCLQILKIFLISLLLIISCSVFFFKFNNAKLDNNWKKGFNGKSLDNSESTCHIDNRFNFFNYLTNKEYLDLVLVEITP